MKRIVSLILSVLLLASLFAMPQASVFAASAGAPAKVSSLRITTANKKKLLKLSWNKQPDAIGYQIYRSTSGKRGSYQKIASVRDKTVYVDKNLKASKTYYYAVRAFNKSGGKYRYGAFAKTNLSTKLTKAYLQKLIQKANKVTLDWTINAFEMCASEDMNDQRNVKVKEDGYSYDRTYARIRSDKYHSVKDIEKDLAQYYADKSLYEIYTKVYYKEFNGKLYGIVGDPGGDFHGDSGKLQIVTASDRAYDVLIDDIYNGDIVYEYKGKVVDTYHYHLFYQNGRWMFDDLVDIYGLYEEGSSYWK